MRNNLLEFFLYEGISKLNSNSFNSQLYILFIFFYRTYQKMMTPMYYSCYYDPIALLRINSK
ncbi:MAG: hypothetical protein RBG13Loki_1508 [Promethearchaeota archaeon CR_4]|nr:MAG: hypothetical protein RBG13Loki_1508 [Candidatus Lokiarchaeota archaeon CR_4]